jgi:hypothetical protein
MYIAVAGANIPSSEENLATAQTGRSLPQKLCELSALAPLRENIALAPEFLTKSLRFFPGLSGYKNYCPCESDPRDQVDTFSP